MTWEILYLFVEKGEGGSWLSKFEPQIIETATSNKLMIDKIIKRGTTIDTD